MILNDQEIRKHLLKKLNSQSIKPKAILEELRVYNGNAIADVVALYSEAHCYEIKGVTDNIDRIKVQGEYYNSVFRKITLVTTINHFKKALKIAPAYWGIMIIHQTEDRKVIFEHIKKAKNNPNFDKKQATFTLWKSEMLNLIKEEKYQKKPREFLANLISETQKTVELSNNICNQLLERHLTTA